MIVCDKEGLQIIKKKNGEQERHMCSLSKNREKEEKEEEVGMVGGWGIGVHPNQSTSSPPALSAEGPTDFCMQTYSRSQLEPSLPRADKDSPRAALSASLIPAASPHPPAHRRCAKGTTKKKKF